MDKIDRNNKVKTLKKTLWKTTRILWLLLVHVAAFVCVAVVVGIFIIMRYFVPFDRHLNPNATQTVQQAAEKRQIAYRLTEPKELIAIIGHPQTKTERIDGGSSNCTMTWGNISAEFSGFRRDNSPLTLRSLKIGGFPLQLGRFAGVFGGRPINIGQRKPVVLRNEKDLLKLDSFWGLAGVSLEQLDLRQHLEFLEDATFDTRTVWPGSDKMPDGFDPVDRIEAGKNPGLGIRKLHKKGIDGRGMAIAILDQPLLKDHIEYTHAITKYESVGIILGSHPQMHGSPVVSIVSGKDCGVAPSSRIHYFAMPMWSWDSCKPYCEVIERILKSNSTSDTDDRIRVVSISMGMFSAWPDFELWKQVVNKANQKGVLVVTCDSAFLNYGTLERIHEKNPDSPESYRRGRYSNSSNVLLVPAGHRTMASYHGSDVYTFDADGGMSWSAPYLAGLAALAFQVNPQIDTKSIVDLWIETAIKTDAGSIVNPVGFMEAVRK